MTDELPSGHWIEAGPSPTETDGTVAWDPYRPKSHFTPPSGWMNDPNGLIHWRGSYHLFYQFNPHGPEPKDIHWGHAISDDLVSWRHFPIALAPSPGGPDQDGCWSGCVAVMDDIPYIIYTGVRGGAQLPCLARAEDLDLLTSWRKYRGNPVIASPPENLKTIGFRDHTIWGEDGHFHQLIGSGTAGGGGVLFHYRSTDLVHWEYLGPFLTAAESNLEIAGAMWECPDFFQLGDRHVLVVSIIDDGRRRADYIVGSYDKGRFKPDVTGTVDGGDHFYAPQSMIDGNGRRLMWGWLRERTDELASHHPTRIGVMSSPRVVSLTTDGRLQSEPAHELEKLRGIHWTRGRADLDDGHALVLAEVSGDSIEIEARIDFGDASEIELVLSFARELQEAIVVRIDRRGGVLGIDSVTEDRVLPGPRTSLWTDARSVQLHVLFDRSVVEVFSDLTVPLTEMVYPPRTHLSGVELTSTGGRAHLESLDAWQLGSIWAPVDGSPGVAAR
jgi:beta-fructofuranosidase